MKRLRLIFCWLGLHWWKQSRPLNHHDSFPAPGPYNRPTRKCDVCGDEEWWSPGYGSGIDGFWNAY